MSTKAVTTTKNELAKAGEASPSERFTMAVIKEFPNGLNGQPTELTSFQRKLIQNYFIKLDGVLKEAESKRMAKSEQYRDALAFSWNNVNMNKLALDVVAYSSIGLDPLQKNHIHPIPYKNSKTNQYDITLMEGFNGLELKARKYGFDVPDDVIFELKFSTDVFKSHKKNAQNKVESYDFEITDDFNRGELEGGFYYMIYNDNPEKNKLVVMNRSQIEKRRPEYASAEFWGGEKDEWKNSKKTGNKVKVEGWEEEMFMKTLKRHCWDHVNIDSQKIDDHLMRVLENEQQGNDREVVEQIQAEANKKQIDFNEEDLDVDFEEVKTEQPIPEGFEEVAEEPGF
ncbi:recombinase RecT [Aestuariibaculum marinum]|uniref:Recombinase RecT n=1 Tax=Aestuariibaculum marinum TaxID=2683592 RepID=A0A8J6U2M8_9FLAO|nr:recombinase RecT [Aestuariibaculum marinum]MBD0822612.1 recombinase RecT [Aestuariibaculum marinum]